MARSPAKRLVGSLLFLLAALCVLAFVFLLYASAINDDTIPLTDETKAVALVLAIALDVIAVALLIMVLARGWSEKAQRAEEAEVFFIPQQAAPTPSATTTYEPVGDLTVYNLAKVPTGARAWGATEPDGRQHPFYYPRSVGGGFYVNDYIPVDAKGTTLKLRTLLGGPYDVAFTDDSKPRSRRAAAPSRPARKEVAAPATPAPQPSQSGLVLQEVATETLPAEPAKAEEVYYDYPGDSHDVEDLEGIGPTYGKRLRDNGVHTTARLAYEPATALAERIQVPRGTVEAWQQMAQLVKVKGIGPQYAEALVRAGIVGIEDLKRRSPARMADQINAYLATLDVNVLGNKITEKRVEGWKESAKQLKRIRLAVPAQ